VDRPLRVVYPECDDRNDRPDDGVGRRWRHGVDGVEQVTDRAGVGRNSLSGRENCCDPVWFSGDHEPADEPSRPEEHGRRQHPRNCE